MGLPLSEIVLVFVIVLVVIIVIAFKSSEAFAKKRELQEQEEAKRTRKMLEQESMKNKMRNGQLTQKIFASIDNAADRDLNVYSISLKERIEDGGHYIEIIYYGNIAKINRPYKVHSLDKESSECRNKGIRVICEKIECLGVRDINEFLAFAQVLLEKLGTEKYSEPDREYWTDVLIQAKNGYPWIMEEPDWRSNSNWQ